MTNDANAQGGPVFRLDVDAARLLDVYSRHRRRLLDGLSQLHPSEWAAPSRCDLWSVHDVASHLADADRALTYLLRAAASGSDANPFAGFDPRAVPNALVEAARGRAPEETLTVLRGTTQQLLEEVRRCTQAAADFSIPVPIGRVSWPVGVNHFFWDSWTHERDALLPVGRAAEPEDEEIRTAGRYALLLAAAAASQAGPIPFTADLDLAGPGGGCFRMEVAGAVSVGRRQRADIGADALRGEALPVYEALAGRTELREVLHGDDAAVERLSTIAIVLRTGRPPNAPAASLS